MASEQELAAIATLRRKRGSIKAKLTNFEGFVGGLQNTYIPNEEGITPSMSEECLVELRTRFEASSNLLVSYEEYTLEILNYPSVESEREDTEFNEFQNKFYSLISKGRALMQKHTNSSSSSHSSTHSVDERKSSRASSLRASETEPSPRSEVQRIKLPQINLPTFSGEYSSWLEYKDTFLSLIHNSIVNDVDKFHYLRASLAGGASQVIKSLEFSANNYATAWQLLCERYDNQRLLIHNHIKAIFNVDPITKESSLQLRKLLDQVLGNIRWLKSLKEPVDSWDTPLCYIITEKLDSITLREWEKHRSLKTVSTFKQFTDFLKARADLLETMEISKNEHLNEKKPHFKRSTNTNQYSRSLVASSITCAFCKSNHYSNLCKTFQNLSVNDRIGKVKSLRLCYNCLKPGHAVENCISTACKKCSAKHHTLLHLSSANTNRENNESAPTVSDTFTAVSANFRKNSSQVLLSTACIQVADVLGKNHNIRALLDSGSQSSYITSKLNELLGLPQKRVNIMVGGINMSSVPIKTQCSLMISSRCNSFSTTISCLVVPQITRVLPNSPIDTKLLTIPNHLTLADPAYGESLEIDMLIGADLFWSLTRVGQHRLKEGPILNNTVFGWIISGPLFQSNNLISNVQCHFSQNKNLEEQLVRFWEVEDGNLSHPVSPEEKACEEHFKSTTFRDNNGRFVVSFPLKISPSLLGDSRALAEQRLLSLERKFNKNPSLKSKYLEFMREYENLGHMTNVMHKAKPPITYFLPHHGVVNENSTTTKLRVVFNGSAPSNTGMSLNELQMVGPTIQDDLFTILLRFRQFVYVMSGDIEKMYRQVLLNPVDRPLQKILWRYDTAEAISEYELNTVTYGTTAASFLAIRCLQQIALECEVNHPIISRIIRHGFYVDDLLTGANTVEEARFIVNTLSAILKDYGFILRKWIANDPEILSDVSPNDLASISAVGTSVDLSLTDQGTKLLGLRWKSGSDNFFFSIDLPMNNKVTKRSILSNTARIFDPLGFLTPCTITAKMLLQQLWSEKISWDASVPNHIHTKWLAYQDNLLSLNSILIPRLCITTHAKGIEIHAFSDASESAYGACVYLRSTNNQGEVFCSLLCAKGRVAPLKPLTIARLELCGAVTMITLVEKVRHTLNLTFDSCVYWTDSTTVLAWINTPAHTLQTFVANRVAQIQSSSTPKQWRHVPSSSNPADYLSRGVKPCDLANLAIWWRGPEWLSNERSSWPCLNPPGLQGKKEIPELRKPKEVVLSSKLSAPIINFSHYSNLTRLERAFAYVLRFIANSKRSQPKLKGYLTPLELQNARMALIRLVQAECFSNEKKVLEKDQSNVGLPGNIQSLAPFMDKDGIIRVGGRLRNSNFSYEKKHPILLLSKHPFTETLFRHEHEALHHSGPQMLLSAVRNSYWPINGRNLAKKVVRSCVKCFRNNPRLLEPLMGDLPERRLIQSHPFSSCGVDYGGPLKIRDRKGRGSKTSKAYICLYVCFCTKAIHIELVSDLTTEAFLASFKRFISRRGKPLHVHSDNGTNFIGASAELDSLGKFLQGHSKNLSESIANEKVNWHFIPAYSPHFGGLWEAGIKSTKYHLKRVAADAMLTFEEMSILLAQIEAILNSRPLTPLSSDPHDFTPLTPAHFLIGRTFLTLPEEDFRATPDNRLSRFQHLQKIKGHFWERWQNDYISELQQRHKWRKPGCALSINDLVILKDDNRPPMAWQLGRIIQLHPGKDNIVRVASIQTSRGVQKRALTKLGRLPIESSPPDHSQEQESAVK